MRILPKRVKAFILSLRMGNIIRLESVIILQEAISQFVIRMGISDGQLRLNCMQILISSV